MTSDEEKSDFSLETLAKIEEDPLLAESDRGCVLIQSTDLENSLRELLMEYFDSASSISKKLLKDIFDYVGPLGTFSSKIKLSYAMGLINKEIFTDLEKIRKIRNIAAHSDSAFTLSSDAITKIMDKLNNDHSKLITFGKYPRYSYKNSLEDESEKKQINETIMKGRGYLRHDKVNFIMSTKLISYEIGKLQIAAKFIGKDIYNKRNSFNSLINEYLQKDV